MEEKIIIDMLTKDSVSIKKQKYIIQNNIEYILGETRRKAYLNSTRGRMDLKNEISEPYVSSILMMWGNVPTVNENIDI